MPSGRMNWPKLTAQRSSIVLLAFNIIGTVIYVVGASHGWVLPEERGLHSATGEPFVWALYAIPTCAFFFALNLAWGVYILIRKQWRAGVFWLATIPIWLVAIIIDFAHH